MILEKKSLFNVIMKSIIILIPYVNSYSQINSPYPKEKMSKLTNSGLNISIEYNRLYTKGRTFGGDMIPTLGKVWRTGVEEPTTFEISETALIEGQLLHAGKYVLYTIPQEDKWTVIFNNKYDQWNWGVDFYKKEQDELRIEVKAKKTYIPAESLSFDITDNGTVSLNWADIQISFKALLYAPFLGILYPKFEDFPPLYNEYEIKDSISVFETKLNNALNKYGVAHRDEKRYGLDFIITEYKDLEIKNYTNKGILAFLIPKPSEKESKIQIHYLIKKRYYTMPDDPKEPDEIIKQEANKFISTFIKELGL